MTQPPWVLTTESSTTLTKLPSHPSSLVCQLHAEHEAGQARVVTRAFDPFVVDVGVAELLLPYQAAPLQASQGSLLGLIPALANLLVAEVSSDRTVINISPRHWISELRRSSCISMWRCHEMPLLSLSS
jgi:hypothetical protein